MPGFWVLMPVPHCAWHLPLVYLACSGGAEAVTLLAANPAVRELLLKPLAMQPASLRCHLSVGAAGGGQGAREAPPWAAAAGEAPQVIVVGSAAAGRDAEAGRSGADGPPGEAEP